jgi:predicted amidohydrolase YtcJ
VSATTDNGHAVLLGRVLTADRAGTEARAVAVAGERISAVGDRSVADARRAAGDAVLDFGDRAIVPGFIDPHVHVEVSCRVRAMMVDCRAPRCGSVEDILDALRDGLWRAEERGVLEGQANLFLDQKLSDRRLPTRHDLDRVSRTVPIVIRAGGHVSIVNTRALELSSVLDYVGRAGMTGGAVVEFDEHGEPTGVVAEVDKALHIPEPSRGRRKEARADGVDARFTPFGVTSVGEISETLEGLRCMDELIGEGVVAQRVSAFLWAPGTMSVDEACDWRSHLDPASPADRFEVRGLKLFADGGYSARNAATRGAYVCPHALRPGSRGRVNLNRRQLASALRKARAAGLQLAVHANGERAQDVVCAAIAAAGGPDGGLPVRIEHAGNLVTSPETTEQWRAGGIVPVPQAVFLYNFGGFLPVYLGDHGTRGRFPFRSLIADGWDLGVSSDLTMGGEEHQTEPLFSMWCAMERRSFSGDLVEPEEAVGFDDALRMHTINAARVLGVERDRGSLEPGKLADAVVLERDPRSVAAAELPQTKVDFVFRGGRLVHRRDGARPFLQA